MSNSNVGSVKISEEVIASIAASAAKEIDGIVNVVPRLNLNLKNTIPDLHVNQKGISVVSKDKGLEISFQVVVASGCKISDVCANVQKRVIDAVTNMTGLAVSKVNVVVSGIV